MPCYIAVGRLVDIGCSSRCILRRSSYISETLLLVLLKLLFIVWLFPVGHLWSSIVLKKQHKTKPPKTLFTLNPGIPGGPGGPGGQIAGHCRVQRQKLRPLQPVHVESTSSFFCNHTVFTRNTYQKVSIEIMKCTGKTLKDWIMTTHTSEKYGDIYFKRDFAAFFVF